MSEAAQRGALSGRTAVVTGGGRGIGAAIALAFADAGAQVAISGRDEAALHATLDKLKARGAVAAAFVADVASPGDVVRLAADVRRTLGSPAIIVNNAGIAPSAKFADTDEALWQKTLDVNLGGPYRISRAFLPDVLAAGKQGRILMIASVAAKVGFAYTSAYSASKHGLLGLSRSLALELVSKGPTVNCVCPGWVDTEMTGRTVANIQAKTGRDEDSARKELENMSPQRRLMTAEEVAAVTLFLASDAAGGVTGQAWNVDGGEVMY
jgi:NAD(P)-dependent dehydrogenase (short-subunit alcohol dehydrogenase family)